MFAAAILRALAEHMIPGIPLSIRISILQQTVSDEELGDVMKAGPVFNDTTVLQQVVEGDTYRNEIVHELDGMYFTAIRRGFDRAHPRQC